MAVVRDYKRLVIDAALEGDNELIEGVDGLEIRVVSFTLMAEAQVDATFRSDTTPISGTYPLVANTGLVNPGNAQDGAHPFETAPGEPLNLNLSSGVQVTGDLVYYLAKD